MPATDYATIETPTVEVKHGDLVQRTHDFVLTARDWLTRSMLDDDYYHHIQWTSEEKTNLKQWGQAPVVQNLIQPKVNYVMGLRERFEMSPKGYPRSPSHSDEAEAFTDITRYLVDATKFSDVESEAMEDFARVGYGGWIWGVKTVGGVRGIGGDRLKEDDERHQVALQHVAWSEFMWDVRSRKFDFSDAEWVGIAKWHDFDRAMLNPLYANSRAMLANMKANGNGKALTDEEPFARDETQWFSLKRGVQIAEMYFRAPAVDERAKKARGWEWFGCHLTSGGFLIEPKRIPFEDDDGLNFCPLQMFSAYCNRHGERYGLTRAHRWMQDEVNHRRSRYLREISGRGFWFYEGAVKSPQEAKQELKKTNPALELNAGAMNPSNPAFGWLDNPESSDGQFNLLAEAKTAIERNGPSPTPNDRAIVTTPMMSLQQDGGVLELGPFFRRARKARHMGIVHMWWMGKMFITKPEILRVFDESEKGYHWLPVNQAMTAGERLQELMANGVPGPAAVQSSMGGDGIRRFQEIVTALGEEAMQSGERLAPPQMEQIATERLLQDPIATRPFTKNNLAKIDVDIVVDEVPHHAIAAHEEFMELMRMVKEGQVQIPAEVLVEASSLRQQTKDKALSVLRRPPDPAAMQANQAQTQANLQQSVAASNALNAQAAKMGAEAQATSAKAAKDAAQADLAHAQTERVGSEIEENLANADKHEAAARADLARAQNTQVPT